MHNEDGTLIPDSPFYRRSIQAVPVDVWRACTVAYQSAASFAMPVRSPSEYKFRFESKLYAFGDNPMTRGFMAVKEFLGEDQVELFPAVMSRIMAFGSALPAMKESDAFARFFQGAEAADGSLMVSKALMDAFASAEFIPGTMGINLDAAFELAIQLDSD